MMMCNSGWLISYYLCLTCSAYFLTGVANNEYCIASTSELLDARQRNWSDNLISELGLPRQLLVKSFFPELSVAN